MMRNITILKAKGPDQLWVKEIPGPRMSQEAEDFQVLVTRMNEYCNTNDTIRDQIAQPRRGQYCLARRTADRMWYRAKIDNMLQTSHGTQADCLLMDYAEHIQVSLHRIIDIPEEFLDFPFQAKDCRLHGIQPLTLTVSFEEFTHTMTPCTEWDTSAEEFFNDMIKDKSAQMTIHSKTRDGLYFITLYVNVEKELVNVNEELVRREFATVKKTDELDEYEAQARVTSPAPSLEAMAMKKHFGPSSSSSREGSIRALSPEVAAHSDERLSSPPAASRVTSLSPSPPLATRQVSPGFLRQEPNEQKPVKSRFQESLKTHKVSAEGLLERSRHDDQGRERGKQGSPSQPMEVLSTAQVKEKIQQLGMPLSQQKGTAARTRVQRSGDRFSPGPGGDHLARQDEKNVEMEPPALIPSSPDTSRTKTQSKGRGFTLEKLQQLSGSDSEKKRESPRPVGSQSRKADSVSSRGSGPEIVGVPQRQSALNPRSPLSSDFSSGDESSKLDRKQNALALLQQMAAKARSPEFSGTASSDNSTHMSPPSGQRVKETSPSPDGDINRPPFRIRPPREQQSSEEASPPKPGAGRGAIRKVAAQMSKRSPRAWSDEKPSTSCSSSDEVGASPKNRIIEQRLNNLMLGQGTQRPSTDIRSHRAKSIASGVLVHGEMPPEPFTSFEEAPFLDSILRQLQKNTKFVNPSAIQSYAWPAILRGRDMVGVSGKKTGKKLAYLLPILQQVKQPSMYSSLPVGCAPIAIVVTPGWKRASDIYSEMLAFNGANKNPKVLLLHGAGSEENNQVQLVNGVEIVICTITCLLRLLKGEHTNLGRLCHLVLDDADILIDDFTAEVKELINEYSAALVRRRTQGKAPSQQMLFASSWTPGLRSYVNTYLVHGEPAVIIAAPLEAAVYARIRWMAKVTNVRQQLQHLKNVLDSCQDASGRAIVFVNTAKGAEDLSKKLLNEQYYTLLAHKDMQYHHIEQAHSDWMGSHRKDSLPVLVMTDDVIHELGITNASCVVHYDFPVNKRILGRRLGTMIDNFAPQIAKKQTSNCQTMLLLLEKDHSQYVPSLSKILSRCSRDLAAQLRLDEAIKARESKKTNVSLCHNLKGRGYCRDYPTCAERHIVMARLDSPGSQSLFIDLPQSGLVKILFTHIEDASCFYGRLLEYRATEGSEPVDMTTKHATLPMDMAMWFGADAKNKQIHGSPQVNELCAFEDDQRAFHRVRVVKLNTRSTGVLESVRVQFVDEGGCMITKASKLLKLPARFHSTPFQAVEVYLCKVKPVDKDRHWTDHANRHINGLIYRRTLDGKVALSLGNTIWLEPLVEKVYLEDLKIHSDAINVRQELLDKKFAESNPEHLLKLRELCEGKIDLPQLVPSAHPKATSSSTILVPDTDSVTGTEMDVYLSAVAYPSLFYVQKCNLFSKLEKLMSTINAKMKAVEDDPDDWSPQVKDICLAKFEADGEWGRGRIKEINKKTGQYDVFFVDFGDSEWHTRADIRKPWNDILQMPFQALECSLADIGPVGEQWGEDEGDALWDMCSGDEAGEKLTLTLKVRSTKCSDTGSQRYIVDLYDDSKTSERCINIGHQMVLEGHAKATDRFTESVFPGATNEEKSISVWLIKLCRQLYEAKEKQRQMELARAIHQLVTNRKCDPHELREEGALMSLCHLVHMLQTDQTVITILLVRSLIHVCYNRISNCREMCRHGGLKEICHFLVMTEEEALLEYICWILKTCAGFKYTVKKCIRDYGGVDGLCQLLLSPNQSSNIINNACASIGVLATDNLRNQDLIQESGAVSALCQMLVTTSCSITQEEILRTLSILATHIRNHDGMRTDGGVQAMCNLIWESDDEKIISLAASSLLSLVSSAANIQRMKEEELEDCLEEYLMTRPFSNTTMDQLVRLFHSLTERDRDGSKKMTSDNLEEFGLVPQDNNQSEPVPVRSNQSGMMNGHGASQSGLVNGLNGSQSGVVNGVEMPDDLPPLEVDEDTPLTKKPKVKWSQKPTTVTLSVELRGVTHFELEVFPKAVLFSTELDGMHYSFDLNLFCQVKTDKYDTKMSGGEVLITLYKVKEGDKWRRLTKSKTKLHFVTLDYDRWSDTSDEEDARFPNKNKKKTKRKVPKLKKTKSGAVNAIPPELDTGSEDSIASDYTDSTHSSEAEFGFADESGDQKTTGATGAAGEAGDQKTTGANEP